MHTNQIQSSNFQNNENLPTKKVQQKNLRGHKIENSIEVNKKSAVLNELYQEKIDKNDYEDKEITKTLTKNPNFESLDEIQEISKSLEIATFNEEKEIKEESIVNFKQERPVQDDIIDQSNGIEINHLEEDLLEEDLFGEEISDEDIEDFHSGYEEVQQSEELAQYSQKEIHHNEELAQYSHKEIHRNEELAQSSQEEVQITKKQEVLIKSVNEKYINQIGDKLNSYIIKFLIANNIKYNSNTLEQKIKEKIKTDQPFSEKDIYKIGKSIIKELAIENDKNITDEDLDKLLDSYKLEFKEFYRNEIRPLVLHQRKEIEKSKSTETTKEHQTDKSTELPKKERENVKGDEIKIVDKTYSPLTSNKEFAIFVKKIIKKVANDIKKEEDSSDEKKRLLDHIIFKEILLNELRLAIIKEDYIKSSVVADEINRKVISVM